MKFVNQRDYPHWLYVTRTDMEGEDREKGKTTTVFTSACGLASAVMVADRLIPNSDFELKDALELSYAVKANYRRGTAYRRFAPAFAEKMDLRLEMTYDIHEMVRCLHTGGAAVILVGGDHDGVPGLFTHGGHYIVAVNEEPDGRIALLDPYFYEGKFEEEGRAGKVELTRDCIILCDKATLDAEANPKNITPYFLFWRK